VGSITATKKTTPWDIFSICRKYPMINFNLSVDTAYLVATEERMLGGEQCTLAIWYHNERGASCHKLNFSGDFTDWFVFSHDTASIKPVG
jgi:disulfide oxidoreductase YuzD